METKELEKVLKMRYPIFSLTRIKEEIVTEKITGRCTLMGFKKAAEGKEIYISKKNAPCYGVITGSGLADGIPNTPGGYGNFMSQGKKGEGFPEGERVKASPEVAEEMILAHPQGVMEGYSSIRIKQYDADDAADSVVFMVNNDQMSGLIHLFNFRRSEYDSVIAPMCSGCASIFRIPFGELKKKRSKAVIGNVDIGSRVYFDQELMFFIVTNKDFKQMLIDADECIFSTEAWINIQKRL